MSSNNAEVVLPYTCRLGEGPVWDARNNTILWVDILQGEIHRYDQLTGIHSIFKTGQMVGCVAPRRSGGLVAGMQNGLTTVDTDNNIIGAMTDPESDIPGNRFNDGKCDPAGRFWAGTMALSEAPGKGNLYTLEKDFSISVKIRGTTISNGMAWSPDHKTFYYIDTPSLQVVAYDYEQETGSITNRRVVIAVAKEDGHPDGMTIDSEGMLWIAHWDGWQVTRRDPHTGRLLLSIRLPVARVTCCTFGGPNLRDLYITSAKEGLTDEESARQPLAGSLFVVRDCGFQGMPAFAFEG